MVAAPAALAATHFISKHQCRLLRGARKSRPPADLVLKNPKRFPFFGRLRVSASRSSPPSNMVLKKDPVEGKSVASSNDSILEYMMENVNDQEGNEVHEDEIEWEGIRGSHAFEWTAGDTFVDDGS